MKEFSWIRVKLRTFVAIAVAEWCVDSGNVTPCSVICSAPALQKLFLKVGSRTPLKELRKSGMRSSRCTAPKIQNSMKKQRRCALQKPPSRNAPGLCHLARLDLPVSLPQ